MAQRPSCRLACVADEELTQEGVVLDPSDPTVAAMFNRLTLSALQTSRGAKWELLARALAASGKGFEETDSVVEHLAGLVVRFSPEHVRVLQLMVAPEQHGLTSESIDPDRLLDALLTEPSDVDRADLQLVIETVWTDLVASGLIGGGFVAGFNRVTDGALLVEDAPDPKASPYEDEGLTASGRRFLAYLSYTPV